MAASLVIDSAVELVVLSRGAIHLHEVGFDRQHSLPSGGPTGARRATVALTMVAAIVAVPSPIAPPRARLDFTDGSWLVLDTASRRQRRRLISACRQLGVAGG